MYKQSRDPWLFSNDLYLCHHLLLCCPSLLHNTLHKSVFACFTCPESLSYQCGDTATVWYTWLTTRIKEEVGPQAQSSYCY